MLLTILAVFARIFSNAYSNVVQKQLTSHGEPSLKVNCFSYIALSAVMIPCLPFLELEKLGAAFWTPMAASGILAAVGNACLIKAVNCGELSVLGPLNSYKVIVSMIVAFFLIGEIPGLWGIIGILLILAGSFAVMQKKQGESFSVKLFLRPDIQFRFYAIFCTAMEAVFLKKTITASNPFTSFAMWCILSAVFSTLLYFCNTVLAYLVSHRQEEAAEWEEYDVFPAYHSGYHDKMRETVRQAFALSRKSLLLLLVLASTTGIMQFTTNIVFRRMQVSYALALFQLSALLSVFFGGFLFHEKGLRRKLAGSLVMVAGAVLIILL